jgi:DNA-binding transcriptional LysR family regulator
MVRMLALSRLRLLRELDARGTVHAVAAALDYSPSAVSAQLAALERDMGFPLTERVGRGLRLTDAGVLLARRAGELLDHAEAVEAELASFTGAVAGTIRVSSFQTGMLRLVAPAVAAVRAEHPGVRIEASEIEVEQALPALTRGALDLVIGDEYVGVPMPVPEGVDREELLDEEVRLILPASHPLARQPTVPLAALRNEVWAAGDPGTSHRQVLARLCRTLGGFEPDLRHRSNDLLVLLTFVRRAGAVALLPDLVGADADPSLAVRGIEEQRIRRTIWALTRTGTATRPAVAAVLAAVRVEAATMRRTSVGRAGPAWGLLGLS